MRFARLDLLRYGHFTDGGLSFPAAASDLHIVFGANEAGKTTARSAIEHFLFGFPVRTALGFKHAYADLRIGASVEQDGDTLAVIRKKGSKNTILDAAGDPSTALESELARMLAGTDAAFFNRMFSLDHDGLRAGGKALAAADANAESAVLSAGSGLSDLLARQQQLNEEAQGLWSPNHSQKRRFYQAQDRLEAADAAIREHAVTVTEWQRLRDTLDQASQRYRELADHKRVLDQQRRELERTRRVIQPVQRYERLNTELQATADVPDLPVDARAVFDTARQAEAEAERTITRLTDQITRLEAELARLDENPALLAQAEVIERLGEQRPRIAGERDRLAEIDTRLTQLGEALAADRAQLGPATRRAGDDNKAEWPGTAALADARRILAEHATRDQALAYADDTLADARQRLERLQAEHDSDPAPADTRAIEAWLAAQARDSDIEADARNAQGQLEQLDRDAARALADLDPPVSTIDTLAALSVPSVTDVEAIGQRMAEARSLCAQRQGEVDKLDDEVVLARASHERQNSDDALPSAEALAELRRRRDACWRRVRQRYIDDAPADLVDQADDIAIGAAAERDPAGALEAALRDADRLADRRFDLTEAIARQAERARALAEREHALSRSMSRRKAATQEAEQLAAEWRTAWQAAGIEPRAPAHMREWLLQRRNLLETCARREDAQARADALTRRIEQYREDALSHLTALDVDDAALGDEPLALLVERTRQQADIQKNLAERRQRAERECRQLAAECTAAAARRKDAAARLDAWQQQWVELREAIGLGAQTTPAAGAAAVEVLDAARQRADEQQELAAEREQIMSRRRHFEDTLASLQGVAVAGNDIESDTDNTPEQVSKTLSNALRQAQSDQRLRETRQADLATDRRQLVACDESRAQARAQMDALAGQASAADRDALAAIIASAERKRTLERDLASELETLEQQGDGQPIADLVAAVAASDSTDLPAQIATLADEIADLDAQINDARDAGNAARRAFDAIGGDERAVTAAADRQNALADMQDAAERYLRVGTAAVLLKWAGHRYSMDRQRPLIERGSTLMQALTGGSITRLTGDFDDRDELQIVGVRADNSRVWPAQMSDGTQDQLYLALRVAAIEHYLERAAPLPVIADDLFINFDDDRALAGLEVLSQLAQKTQVLFFTHHQHLRDMASAHLGQRVTTHTL